MCSVHEITADDVDVHGDDRWNGCENDSEDVPDPVTGLESYGDEPADASDDEGNGEHDPDPTAQLNPKTIQHVRVPCCSAWVAPARTARSRATVELRYQNR